MEGDNYMRSSLALAQIGLALVIWTVAIWGTIWGREPFTTWLYLFAWWPLLLFLDGLLYLLKGESWLWSKTRDLARLLAWSGFKGRPRDLGTWQPLFLIIGAACAMLPLVFPRYAFPLIWLAFIFLFDPFCDLLGGESLTKRWAAGERQQHLCLLAAGLFCGFWWEMWNYPARAQWIYTLPVLNFGRIFEVPLLVSLGFLPFALECAVMYNFLLALENRVLTSPSRRRLFWLLQGAFWLAAFWAIDTWTVLSYR